MKKTTVFAIIFCSVVLAAIVFFGVFFTVDEIAVRYDNDVTATDKATILNVIDIDAQTNIFSINEKKIKQKVETAFTDNSIEVVSVVRSFPNKVTVVVRERKQLFKVRVKYSENYVAPDKDFRRNKVYSEAELDSYDLIEVNGFDVSDSFAVDGCYQMRDFVNELIGLGFNMDAVTTFVDKIDFTEQNMTVTLFDGATLAIDRSNVAEATKECVNNYLATPYAQRSGKAF